MIRHHATANGPVPFTPEEEAEWEAREAAQAAVALANARAARAAEIDAAVLAVFEKPNILGRVYERREAEARAYKAAGYTGTPGEYLANFATPAGLTAQAAADIVIAQADGLRQGQDDLEALRMKKNLVMRAATVQEADQTAVTILAQIKAIAAQLP